MNNLSSVEDGEQQPSRGRGYRDRDTKGRLCVSSPKDWWKVQRTSGNFGDQK